MGFRDESREELRLAEQGWIKSTAETSGGAAWAENRFENHFNVTFFKGENHKLGVLYLFCFRLQIGGRHHKLHFLGFKGLNLALATSLFLNLAREPESLVRSVYPAPRVLWTRAVTTRDLEPSLIPTTLGSRTAALRKRREPRQGGARGRRRSPPAPSL